MIRPPTRCPAAAGSAAILLVFQFGTAPLLAQAIRESGGVEPPARRAATYGPALTFGPLVGRIEFADELVLPRQQLVGATAGLDLNRYFGLQGFYWRGVNREFTELEPIQGYGGEAQLSLRLPGIFALLSVGAGRIDFRSGYVGEPSSLAPEDQTALIAGGGLGISLGRHLRIDVAARDYILSESGLGDVGRTDRILHNPLFSVGLTFVLTDREAQRRREWERIERERLQADIEAAFATRDRFLAELAKPSVASQRREEMPAPRQGPAPAAPEGTITIPVPREGEIYLRYGTPGGVRIESQAPAAAPGVVQPVPRRDVPEMSEAELRALVREAVREAMRSPVAAPSVGPPATMPLEERLDQLERRLIQLLDALIEQRLREREQRAAPLPPPPGG